MSDYANSNNVNSNEWKAYSRMALKSLSLNITIHHKAEMEKRIALLYIVLSEFCKT